MELIDAASEILESNAEFRRLISDIAAIAPARQ